MIQPECSQRPSKSQNRAERIFTSVSVAVFAYNEQAAISESLASILATSERAVGRDQVTVHVLANGCTDRTPEIVQGLAENDARIVLHELTIGDKSETWNEYVHSIADLSDDQQLHVFMDGDVTATADIIASATAALKAAPKATACSIMPAEDCGRNRAVFEQLQTQDGAIFGNLYALTAGFLREIRQREIRLPRGLVGDDALVTEMVAFGLDRQNEYSNRNSVRPDGTDGFLYEGLSPFRFADIHLYVHRLIRYQIRTWQVQRLQHVNFDQMPADTEELDQQILQSLEGRRLWNPIHRMARKRLRKRGSTSYSKS